MMKTNLLKAHSRYFLAPPYPVMPAFWIL